MTMLVLAVTAFLTPRFSYQDCSFIDICNRDFYLDYLIESLTGFDASPLAGELRDLSSLSSLFMPQALSFPELQRPLGCDFGSSTGIINMLIPGRTVL